MNGGIRMPLDFVLAYFFTNVIETVLLLALMEKRFPSQQIIRNSLIANSITLPIVWFVFPWLIGIGSGYPIQIAISELFAFGGEAALYWRLFQGLKPQDAIAASLVCNLISFLIGLAL